jgi:hypothetical protein
MSKFWITKYALSAGIYSIDGVTFDDAPRLLRKAGCHEFFYKPEWHHSEEEAKIHASKMVKSRIASLEKELNGLRKLEEIYGPVDN